MYKASDFDLVCRNSRLASLPPPDHETPISIVHHVGGMHVDVSSLDAEFLWPSGLHCRVWHELGRSRPFLRNVVVSGAVSLVWEACKGANSKRGGGEREMMKLLWSVGIGSGFPSLFLVKQIQYKPTNKLKITPSTINIHISLQAASGGHST